ncbi:MAG: ion transporter [Candidatus Poribacteria bacterium]|nr:ion transporter [Candidatus Poribacteria bacterium]
MEAEATVSPKPRRENWFDRFIRQAFGNVNAKSYQATSMFIIIVIFVSILLLVFSTVDYTSGDDTEPYAIFFLLGETIVLIIFTLEYAANVYVAARKRDYIFGWWGIVDLAAIVPSFMVVMAECFVFIEVGEWTFQELRVARVFRVLRFLRLLRIAKLMKVIHAKSNESKMRRFNTFRLDLEIYFTALFSVLVVSSTLIYYAEFPVQPEVFENIPTAMWWAIVTMTTVGYGDMTPQTAMGKIVAGCTALSGLALFALLMSVMGKSMLHGLFGVDVPETEDESVSVPQQIEELGRLRDLSLLTEDEFQSKKTDLLTRM